MRKFSWIEDDLVVVRYCNSFMDKMKICVQHII